MSNGTIAGANPSLSEIDNSIHDLVARHEQLNDRDCIMLYAGTNTMNPRARALLSSSIGGRPALGHPGEKYNKGMIYSEQIEATCTVLLKRLFKAQFVEHRVASGSMANLYACMATCNPGDVIFSFPDWAAGHPTHRSVGAAGLYGLNIRDVPIEPATMDIDVPALREKALVERPKLIIVAGSMCLFPYNVSGVRAVADEVGARVLYDAAHMGGLIVGGEFQDPLREGAHLLTGSTYKSFGGPSSGFVATNDSVIASRIDAIAYPGLTANFDMSKTASLAVGILDLLQHGHDYAKMCVANAQALAADMDRLGLDVFAVPRKGFTASHHIALRANNYGGGDSACKRLERANIIATGIGLPGPQAPDDYNAIRIGTQEITRWGMQPDDMCEVAEFIANILVRGQIPESILPKVLEFRGRFQALHYIRPSAESV